MAPRRATAALAFGADPIVVAYGMGVDSTAMLIGLRNRKVRIDLILFADTGSEKPETMAYLPVIQDWLAAQAMPPVTVIKRTSPRAGDTSLHGECLRKSVLPSLAYGGHSCSLKWKVDPQWRYTQRFFGWDRRRQSWPHGPYVTKLIGYDAGPRDSRRQANAAGKWPPGHRYRYPLGEWGWTRELCAEVIAAEGLSAPVKSACWMCPASKRAEVDWLAAEHPDLADAAIEMERRAHARGLRTTQGLGRRWSWSEHLGLGNPRPLVTAE
ncbi:phosphoadenosine phosphosulfate reductase [Acidisoma cellulosilytica]|uniref:Phosphoadenosine phosphosulfate reductase n=1 Tax=Acidisoma cellulosilyticum TaxID=2802395 RepID=A0A964E5Q2_9PROT|nr:phosphoadenosine phosphosulfate reductase [Acidisoma cellulosilyticum]MCB8882930.1 phosphoadenosine phosphosulfate reductase [Acidisoma cellulosilyticum]